MTFRYEAECELCKQMRYIGNIIGTAPYCDECYEKVAGKK